MVSSICQEGGRSSGEGVLGLEEVGFAGVFEVLGLEEGEVVEEGAAPRSGKGEVITNCSTFSN